MAFKRVIIWRVGPLFWLLDLMTYINRHRTIVLLTLLAFVLTTGSAQSTSLDWRMVYFKSGHPIAGETLEQSLDSTVKNQDENLLVNVSILKRYPNILYDLMGRASETECVPESCMALSGRRAQLVYDYLLEHGIQACQIKSVIANGTNYPIATSQEGSLPDRSVELLVARDKPC